MKKLALLLATVSITCAMALSMVACNENKESSTGSSTGAPPSPPAPVSDVFLNTPITDASYAKECDQQGTITEVTYNTRAYAVENYYAEAGEENVEIPIEKTMYVYTPYNYDPSQQYNVMFLMHGGGESEGYWFAEGDNYEEYKDSTIKYGPVGNITQNIVDNLIKDGTIDPVIVVTPTYTSESTSEEYPTPDNGAQAAPFYFAHFWKELRYDIMPYLQENYSTYAEEATDEGFTAARDHFGFIGFSMGSRCTYVTIWDHNLDYFSYIGNLSEGTGDDDLLNDIIVKINQGEYKDLDIGFYYVGCGEWDSLITTTQHAYDEITTGAPSKFLIGDDVSKGNNAYFNTHLEGGHEYRCWVADFYNCLQVFFK